MRTNAWLAIFGAVAAQTVMVSSAQAATNDAVLVGVVLNPETNEVIEGALVTVTGDKLQGERYDPTDERGVYRIPDLPPGTYIATAQFEGVKLRAKITLRAGETTRINFKLVPAEEIIEIEVPVTQGVDTSSSNQGLGINSDMLERVPIATPTSKGGAARSFEGAAVAAPTASNDLYGTSSAGTTSPENKYTVDGLSVSDPAFGLNGTGLNIDFVEEVIVETGGYMPEYGRTTGAVISAITKSGSNEFHGGVWGFYSPGQLEGYRTQPIREGATIQAERQLLGLGDAGFDIGGRIIKDKLWFYAGVDIAHTSYNVATSWNRQVVDPDTGVPLTDDATGYTVTERIPGTRSNRKAQATTIQALGKLTYAPNSKHTIELLGIYSPTVSGGRGTYGIDATRGVPEVNQVLGTYDTLGHQYRDDSADLQLQWNARPTNDWDISTSVGWHNQRNHRMANDGSRLGSSDGLAGQAATVYRQNNPEYHSVTDFVDLPGDAASDACDPWEDPMDASNRTITCPATLFQVGGAGFLRERQLNRLQVRSNAALFAVAAGHHLVKFGVDFEYMQYDSARGYSGGSLYRESTSASYYQDYRRYGYLTAPDQVTSLPSLEWRTFSTTIGGFVQDSWSIADKVTLNAGVRYDAQHLFGGDGRLSLALPNQISPRAGLVWDPTQEGKAKIFANYARFYQSVPLNLADRAGSGEPGVGHLYDPSICDPSDPDSQATDCQSDSDSRLAIGGPSDNDRYTYSYGAGKTAIDPNLKPQSSDEIVAGGEYEILPGAKLGLSYSHRWLNRVVEDMSRDEATTYFIGNPGYGIAKDFPKGKRVYDSVVLYFDKRFSKNWLLSGSYTLAFLRGNIAGLFRPETGQLDPNINSDFDLISLLDNRFGPLPGDNRHNIKVFTAGEIPLGKGHALMVGGGFRASSGGPTNVLGSHEIYGSGEAFLVNRGGGERLPWVFRIDTNIGYRKYFTEDLSMDFTMNVYNIANFQSVVAVDESYTYSDVIPIEGGTLEDLETHTDTAGDPIVENPNFGNATAYQSPRLFRFGVRLNF